MIKLVWIILLFSSSALATSELSLSLRTFTSTINRIESSGGESTLKSKDQSSYSLNYKWFLSSRVHLVFGFEQEQYNFEIPSALSDGDSKINTNEFSVGVRFVVSPKIAFILLSKQKEEVGYKISNNLIDVFAEELNIFSIGYNQVLVQFRPFNFGINAFYDVPSSGSEIEDRSAYGARAYSVIGRGAHRVRISYALSVIDFEIGTNSLKNENSKGTLEYMFRF